MKDFSGLVVSEGQVEEEIKKIVNAYLDLTDRQNTSNPPRLSWEEDGKFDSLDKRRKLIYDLEDCLGLSNKDFDFLKYHYEDICSIVWGFRNPDTLEYIPYGEGADASYFGPLNSEPF